jgi:hypothetical protein
LGNADTNVHDMPPVKAMSAESAANYVGETLPPPRVSRQTAVAQKVLPCANDSMVDTSASP